MSRVKNQQSETLILKQLATTKEFEQYKMKKAIGISYPTILKHLKKLEKYGLVKCVKREKSEKGGKQKKIYAITLKGLWAYLSEVDLNTQAARKDLMHTINLFPDMLLFFYKWPSFVKASVDNIMLKSFMYALSASWIGYEETFSSNLRMRSIFESNLSHSLDIMTIVNPLLNPKLREKLETVYLNDPDIMNVVKAYLLIQEEQHKETEAIRSWLQKETLHTS